MAGRVLAAFVLAALRLALDAQAPPASPPFTAGEIIVKFSSTSRMASALEQAAARGEKPTDEVRTALRRLSKELGIGLDPIRLGSGGTLLVSVREGDLLDTIARRLRERRSVKEVRAVPHESGMVRVQFGVDTREASSLGAEGAAEREAAVRSISTRLEKLIGFPLTAKAGGPGELVVGPALPKYTLQLVERLNRRSDVEYAQPNYTFQLRRDLDY